MNHARRPAITLALILSLAGCGGGGYGGSSGNGDGAGGTYTGPYYVGGQVYGLTGSGLVLRDNGADDTAITRTGGFSLTTKLAKGSAYSVTVYTQPTNPAQTCVVLNGAGTVGSADVSNVIVDCTIDVAGTFFGVDYGVSGDDASFGITSFNGNGHFTSVSTENDAGNITSGITDSGTYAVADSQAVVFNFNNGAISSAGNAIVSVDLNEGEQAYVDLEINQGEDPFTNADLAGSYQVVTYGNSGDSAALWTLIADGTGNFTGSEVQNNAGAITQSAAISGTYAVATDGTVTVSPTARAPLSGGLGADGTLVLSQLTGGQTPSITFGIKQGQTALTTADVGGTYVFATEQNSGDLATLWAVNFDHETGRFSAAGKSNNEGAISSISMAGVYVASANGSLTLTPDEGNPLTGGISADGGKLVLTDLNAGDLPSVWIGINAVYFSPWDY